MPNGDTEGRAEAGDDSADECTGEVNSAGEEAAQLNRAMMEDVASLPSRKCTDVASLGHPGVGE